jgi:dihydroneopterin aldolase/2-amino-4-hydroxy-6-hydroxymethyldihydropteridine diphosphokinase
VFTTPARHVTLFTSLPLGRPREREKDEIMTLPIAPIVRHGITLDMVAVTGIAIQGKHGVAVKEKQTPQPFVADIVVHLDTRQAGREDDLAKTADYGALARVAAETLSGPAVDLLETLAERIALTILEKVDVFAVDVVIHKPQAPVGVPISDAYVAIRRDAREGRMGADKRIGSAAGLADDPLSPLAVPPPKDNLDERPAAPVAVVLAIGGNIGDVEYTLARAIEDLGRVEGIRPIAVSPLVSTKPVGGPAQPDFLNAVVKVETTLSPRALLHVCQGIEMIHGRERLVQDGPRTLDIDLVVYGNLVATSEDLTIPHPRAHQRAFVLAPWAIMEPAATLPASPAGPGGKVADLASSAPDTAGVAAVRNPWDPGAVIASRMGAAGAPSQVG